MQTMEKADLGLIELQLEFSVSAPVAQVWKCLTEETDAWWHKDFYMLLEKGTVTIEPWAGGRIFEDNGKGESMLWYHVIWVVPEKTLSCAGFIAPPWGGPATTLMQITLEANGNEGTTLRITDSLYGVVTEKLRQDTEGGWKTFYTEGFIPYVEAK